MTKPDMISRAILTDALRSVRHCETAVWRFADNEITHQDLDAACLCYPIADAPTSSGPEQDCVVDKVEAFETELAIPSTPDTECLLALKFCFILSETFNRRCTPSTIATAAVTEPWPHRPPETS